MAQDLKNECVQLEKGLHGVVKQCNNLNRLLEHAVWEEDMVVEETILFNGSLDEFLELIAPLIRSRKWTVNGRHEVKPFLRSLDSIFHIRHGNEGEVLALGTLVNAVLDYLSVHRDD
ncbi:hypothetical protein [Parabacteroides faecis]|uniref:hypothetical protein n=1 Tax=Parabacteroides faecis TaxID=1217282 RepID=UPI003520EA6E